MKKKLTSRWIWFISYRYLFTKRKEKGHVAAVLSILGISLGVATLVIVLSVMNGFQHNFIDNINEVISYHLRVDQGGEELSPEMIEELKSLKGINAMVPFIDFQTTIKGEHGEPGISLIRGLPPQALEEDEALAMHLSIESGSFDLTSPRTIVLGAELALNQGVFPGDKVTLASLVGDKLSNLALLEQEFEVTGTVRSGYLEYDSSLGFISLESAREIMDESYIVYGIKTNNVNRDSFYKDLLAKNLSLREGTKISTWKEYNRAFFDALRLEKIMMFLVVSLVFLVVAVNIYHSLKRSVSERMEEIALLKSIGASPNEIKMIFLQEGLLLGVVGVVAGMIPGVFLSVNINHVFSFVERVSSLVMGLFSSSGISIYSSRTFYLENVPVLIMPKDLIYIGLIAIFLSLLGAWMATAPVAEIKPAEVLNIE